MYILTDKSLINCNNAKTIEIVRDNGKYAVMADPGGIIARFDTQQKAINCIDSIACAIANDVKIFDAKERYNAI